MNIWLCKADCKIQCKECAVHPSELKIEYKTAKKKDLPILARFVKCTKSTGIVAVLRLLLIGPREEGRRN